MIRKRLRNKKGFISIETILIGGAVIALTGYLLFQVIDKGEDISSSTVNLVSKDSSFINKQTLENIKNNNYETNPKPSESNNELDLETEAKPVEVSNPNKDTVYEHITDVKVEPTNTNYFSYAFVRSTDRTIKITGYSGNEKNVVIPSIIDGNTVIEIEERVFLPRTVNNHGKNNGPQLETLVLPNTIERIGNSVFEGNKLKEITIPRTVTYIGQNAFKDNPELTLIRNLSNYEINSTHYNSNAIIIRY